MKIITYTFLLLLSLPSFAQSISIDGTEYKLEIKESHLECNDFSISSVIKSLPFSIRESRIPYKRTMGHKGNSHLMNQKLSFKTNNASKDISYIYKNIHNYSKIDAKRPYISAPVKCIENKSVLFTFYGGGNCSTVCEAYALVSFKTNGTFNSLKGLNYNEYKKLKGN